MYKKKLKKYKILPIILEKVVFLHPQNETMTNGVTVALQFLVLSV